MNDEQNIHYLKFFSYFYKKLIRMEPFGLSDEEKKRIRDQHEKLEKEAKKKKEEDKAGISLTKNKKTPE